jgi:hypothetical protein
VGPGCGPFTNYLVFQSSVALTGNPASSKVQRWGDYSSTSIDSAEIIHGVNERINSISDPTGASWGTHFFNATIRSDAGFSPCTVVPVLLTSA